MMNYPKESLKNYKTDYMNINIVKIECLTSINTKLIRTFICLININLIKD